MLTEFLIMDNNNTALENFILYFEGDPKIVLENAESTKTFKEIVKEKINFIIDKIDAFIHKILKWLKEKIDPILNKIKAHTHKIDKDMLNDFKTLNTAFSQLYDELAGIINIKPHADNSDEVNNFTYKTEELENKYNYVKSTPQYTRFFNNDYSNKQKVIVDPSKTPYLFELRSDIESHIKILETHKTTFKKLLYEGAEIDIDETDEMKTARLLVAQFVKVTTMAINFSAKHIEAVNKVLTTLKISVVETK